MATYTRGEWEVNPDFEPGDDISIEVQGAPIATVLGTDSFPCLDEDDHDIPAIQAENAATARLIAAAPDLLAACETALRVLRRCIGGDVNPDFPADPQMLVEAERQVFAAIAKAKE